MALQEEQAPLVTEAGQEEVPITVQDGSCSVEHAPHDPLHKAKRLMLAVWSLGLILLITYLVLGMVLSKTTTLPPGATLYEDILYIPGGTDDQTLDIYLPKNGSHLPLIINIHGGSFSAGDKSWDVPIDYLSNGYAVASVNYRLSWQAKFPAQLQDLKAAVRWLRAHASEYRLDPDRFAAWGISAGGHLAAMLGTTGNTKEFDVGENLNQSSHVQAVVDYCGPTDFLQEDAHRILPNGKLHNPANSPESRLIGGPIQENKEKAERANPIRYITKDSPPFLVCHGDADLNVPFFESQILVDALKKAGVPVTFHPVLGGGHQHWKDPQVPRLTKEFLAATLKPEEKAEQPSNNAVAASKDILKVGQNVN